MKIKRHRPGEAGQGLIEYIILVALIALVSVVATENLGKKVKSKMNEIREAFDSRVTINGGRESKSGAGGILEKAKDVLDVTGL